MNIYVIVSTFHYLEKSQFKTHKKVITISEQSKRDIMKYYEIKENNIKVIPNGVNIEKFNPTNYSEELRKRYGNKIILYSGLMVQRKNIHVLLKAFKYINEELPDVKLILTGEGNFLEEYKELTNSLGIESNVHFLGFVSDQKLLKLLATADLFVFPSKKEGFGQVIIESLASGTPVICADIPPMADIIDDAGKVFEVGNPKDLAKKILNLFQDSKSYSNIKKNTHKIAKRYQWSRIGKKYQNYIKKVIKSKKE